MLLIYQFIILLLGIFFLIFLKIIKLNNSIFLFFRKKLQNKIYVKFPYIYRNTLIYIPLLSLIDSRGIGRFTKNIFYRTYFIKNQFILRYPSKKVFIYPSIHHINPNLNILQSLVFVLDIIPIQFPSLYDDLVLADWKDKFSKIINSAINIYTISHTSKYAISKIYKREDISVIYPGADHFNFKNLFFKKKLNIKTDFIIFLGSTTSANKNIQIILDNFDLIDKSISLVVIGQSSNLSKNYSNSRIIFTGFISDYDKDYLIKKSLFMICPSINEGFGFSQFEAAKFSKPSIMSNIKIYKELWHGCGFFCSTNATNQWINKINFLVKNRIKITEMGLKAFKNYTKFTWNKTISNINNEIDKLN